MSEFWAAVMAAMPGVIASTLVSGVFLHYFRMYIDKKLKEDEEHRKREHDLKVQRNQLEMQRRHAAGRLFFWMHHAMVKPPPNGELEEAFEAYQKAEAEQKALEQKILADVYGYSGGAGE